MAVLPQLYSGVLFAWHPLLMVLGYLGFMTEGILAAYKFRNLDGTPRVLAIQNHGWIQLASSTCVGLGLYIIYRNKAINGKLHFSSLHGKVGAIVLILTAAAPVLGISSFKKLGLITKFPERWQPQIKWLHRALSIFTWMLALVAMQLDLPHPAVFQGFWCRLWQAGVLALGACVLFILRQRIGKTSLPTTASRSRVNSFSSFSFLPSKTR